MTHITRALLALTLASTALIGAALADPGAAVTGATYLCGPTSTYSCTGGGYAGVDPWGYHGSSSTDAAGRKHNCTAYAAFRAAKNGSRHPGRNLGDASAWASNARAAGFVVDQKPAVGAIAQWNANVGGAGSSGHVAYVEQVTTSHIVISDDNWGRNVTTRQRIPRNSAGWPSNFIHFADVRTAGRGGAGRITVDGEGNLRLLGRKRAGTAHIRRGVIGEGWDSSWTEMGSGGWAQVAITADKAGDLWFIGVKTNGQLYTRRADVGGTGWGSFQSHGTGWSTSSPPAITARPDRGITFAAIGASGRIYSRSWTGTWQTRRTHSPNPDWATTSITNSGNDLWLIATKRNGSLYTQRATIGSGWNSWTGHGTGYSTTTPPSITARPERGITWAAVTASGLLTTRTWAGSWGGRTTHGQGSWA
ncbi:MAG TPA: CHAP domain-containing protein [Iamia sp.]|nr:CHAP domain-containing protein [Iamia sp.]